MTNITHDTTNGRENLSSFPETVVEGGGIIFKKPTEFSSYIEQKAFNENTTILDTMLEFIEQYDVEPEKLKPLISDSLKNKLYQDFVNEGLIDAERTLQTFFE